MASAAVGWPPVSSAESDSQLPKADDVIAGKYHVVRMLGEGGMGVVYEAVHKRLRQRVAIKMILPRLLKATDFVARFEREARAASQIRGPNVARVIDVDVLPNGVPYMVMEYLEGNDLSAELRNRGRLPIAEAVGFVLDACTAMHEAHSMGIIHRDLKPSNLFVCGEGGRRIVKVLDFGISKMTMDSDPNVTATQTTIGTPLYMSPEQVRSAKHVDGRSDIWSLGVILYELIAGRPPFEGGPTAVAAAIVADVPTPLATLRTEVPVALDAAVMKALTKDMKGRHTTIREFADALRPFAPSTWVPLPGDSGSGFRPVSLPVSLAGSAAASASARTELPSGVAKTELQTPALVTSKPAAAADSSAAAHAATAGNWTAGASGGGAATRNPPYTARRGALIAVMIMVPLVAAGAFLIPRMLRHDDAPNAGTSANAPSATLAATAATTSDPRVQLTAPAVSTNVMAGSATASASTTTKVPTTSAPPPTSIKIGVTTKPIASTAKSAPPPSSTAATTAPPPATTSAPPSETGTPVHI